MTSKLFTYWLGTCTLMGAFMLGGILGTVQNPNLAIPGGLIFVGLTAVMMYLKATREDK